MKISCAKKTTGGGRVLLSAVFCLAAGAAYLLLMGAGQPITQAQEKPPQQPPPGQAPAEQKSAEQTDVPPPPPDEALDEFNNDSYVNFLVSEELTSRLALLIDYEQSGRWADAVKMYQDLLLSVSAGECVISEKSGDTFVGVRGYLQQRMAGLPANARAMYRGAYDRAAEKLVEEAVNTGRMEFLQKAVDNYLFTTSGVRALQMLADAAFEQRDLRETAFYLEQMTDTFPDKMTAANLSRLAICFGAMGENARFDAALKSLKERFPNSKLLVDGKEVDAAQYVVGFVKTVSPPEGSFDNWPAALTGRVLARRPQIGKVAWSAAAESSGSVGPRFVAVRNNVLYINGATAVEARSLFDGRGPLWRFSLVSVDCSKEKQAFFASLASQHAQGWPTAITIKGDKLYTSVLGMPLCLDARSGQLLWFARLPESSTHPAEGETHLVLGAAPVVRNDNVYSAAVQHGTTEDTYLLFCHDALTGGMKWERDICRLRIDPLQIGVGGGQMGVSLNFTLPAILSEEGGMIFFSTNAGVVAAVDSHNGDIVWLTRYDRGEGGDIAYRMKETWSFDAPVLAGGLLLVAPQDSTRMYAFDARSGLPLWFRDRISQDGDFAHLVAVDAARGLVFLGGDTLTAYDMEGMTALEPAPVEGGVAGVGLIAGGDLYVPTNQGIIRVDIEASLKERLVKTEKVADWPAILRETPKNQQAGAKQVFTLASVSDAIIAASSRGVAVFYDAAEKGKALRAALAAGGDEGPVRLLMAQIASVAGDMDAAMREYDVAIKRLGEKAKAVERFDPDAPMQSIGTTFDGASPETPKYYSAMYVQARQSLSYAAYTAALGLFGQSADAVDYKAMYAEEVPADKDALIVNYLKLAAKNAMGAREFVDAQLILIRRAVQKEDWAGCLDLLVEMGRRHGRASYDFTKFAPGIVAYDVGLASSETVEALLKKHGRALYDKYETEALDLLARAQKSDSPSDYYEVVRQCPNSLRAREALMAAMQLAGRKGIYRDMVFFADEYLWRYPDDGEAAAARALLSEGCEGLKLMVEARRALEDLGAAARKNGQTEMTLRNKKLKIADYLADRLGEGKLAPVFQGSSFNFEPMEVRQSLGRTSPRLEQSIVLKPQGCAPPGAEDSIFIVGIEGLPAGMTLACARKSDMEQLWAASLPCPSAGDLRLEDYALGYSGGSVVIATTVGLLGFDPASGALRWKLPLEVENDPARRPPYVLFDNTMVYFIPAGGSARIFAVESRTGKIMWVAALGGRVTSVPAFVNESVAVPVESGDPGGPKSASVRIIARLDGTEKWKIEGLTPIKAGLQVGGVFGGGGVVGAQIPQGWMMRNLFAWPPALEIRSVDSDRLAVLSGDGIAVYNVSTKGLLWLNPDVGNVDNQRLLPAGGPGLEGPEAAQRLLIGDGWCAVATEHYSKVRTYDAATGAMLAEIEPTKGWLLRDVFADRDRLHLFSYSWAGPEKFFNTSAACFDPRTGRLVFENVFETGQFAYLPLLTEKHCVYVRGWQRERDETGLVRVYVYSRKTGKIVAAPIEIDDMACGREGRVIDINGSILVKGRSKTVLLRMEPQGK